MLGLQGTLASTREGQKRAQRAPPIVSAAARAGHVAYVLRPWHFLNFFQGDFAETRKRVQQCAFLLGESKKIPNAVIGGERLADVVFPDSIIREVVFGCRVVWKEKTCRDLWDRGRRDIEPGATIGRSEDCVTFGLKINSGPFPNRPAKLNASAVASNSVPHGEKAIVRLRAGFGVNDHQLRSGTRTYAGTEFFGARIQRRGAD
jgi:hypothetical protein